MSLVNAGFASLNYKGMGASAGFKVVRFCAELDKANKAIEEERVDLIKRTLGDRLEAFNAYQQWAQKKEGELPEGAMTEDEAKTVLEELVPLINELFNAEADIKLNPLTEEEYYALVEANDKIELGNAQITMTLKGILWEEKKEE